MEGVPIIRTPSTLQEIILELRRDCGIMIPTTDEQWAMCPRTSIDIRRNCLIQDGLREAKKQRFDPAKLLNVIYSIIIVNDNTPLFIIM